MQKNREIACAIFRSPVWTRESIEMWIKKQKVDTTPAVFLCETDCDNADGYRLSVFESDFRFIIDDINPSVRLVYYKTFGDHKPGEIHRNDGWLTISGKL